LPKTAAPMKRISERAIERLASAGSRSSDPPEERLRKAILVFLASIYFLAGIVWAVSYFALGLPVAGSIPLAYSVLSGLSLLYFFYSKHYPFFRFSQLCLILLLPFLLQFFLGGFAPSGTAMIWAILSPVGALMFAGTRQSLPWFIAYLVMLVVSGLFEPKPASQPAPIPPHIQIVFFIMNLGGVSSIFYVLLRYFVKEREQAMAVLDQARRRAVQEKERVDKIRKVLSNFVPETAKNIIEKDPDRGQLDKYLQDATVLFLDIEGFTILLQKYSIEWINRIIEAYFSIFFDLIQKNGGDVNEMAGDGMMVIFLDPDPKGHTKKAVQAALEIQRRCLAISGDPGSHLFPIQVNIGISTGEVYLGSTKMRGTGGDRWTFTASGPVTIMASRLSDYAKAGQILIDSEAARRITGVFPLTSLGNVRLKNFRDAVEVFQVNLPEETP
jgi:adenylate cyclase